MRGIHGQWQHRWVFILAAVGSAVGLGNIWKFPYITGENGGGAFVLVYLVCIALIGIPVMLAEVVLGRRGRMSPIHTMQHLAKEAGVSPWWAGIGWSGALAGLLILSFYSVVAGWAFHYLGLSLGGQLANIDAEGSGALFSALLGDATTLTLWHSLFLALTLAIVATGVVKGLGSVARFLMPVLFALLVLLVIYSAAVGEFAEALGFLFRFDFSALSWSGVQVALGHAFFTLSLGMGAIMAYGAYLPDNQAGKGKSLSLTQIVFTIAALDTLVALLAGLVIFPIVFANPALEPSAGPGLLFVSLPVAFGSMVAGSWFAALFFFLIALAAISSAISMIEPTVAWLVEVKGWSRNRTTWSLGLLVWLVGMGTVLSFNHWSGFTFGGLTFFESLDFVTANFMLPLGGLFIALFVAWHMAPAMLNEELGDIEQGYPRYWYLTLRYISPLLLALVFVFTLYTKLSS